MIRYASMVHIMEPSCISDELLLSRRDDDSNEFRQLSQLSSHFCSSVLSWRTQWFIRHNFLPKGWTNFNFRCWSIELSLTITKWKLTYSYCGYKWTWASSNFMNGAYFGQFGIDKNISAGIVYKLDDAEIHGFWQIRGRFSKLHSQASIRERGNGGSFQCTQHC